MKKRILLYSMILLFFFGCNVNFVDNENNYDSLTNTYLIEDKPDVSNNEQGHKITITAKKRSIETVYINFYRQEENEDSPIVPIGIIYTKNLPNNTTYSFQDLLTQKKIKYRYYVRYCDEKNGSKTYYKSKWSDYCESKEEINLDKKLMFQIEGNFAEYKELEQKIILLNELIYPDFNDYEKYLPRLVIKKGTMEQVISLCDPVEILQGKEIFLRNILPNDFFGDEIQLVGIVGQKEDFEEDGKTVKSISWTKCLPIKITGTYENKIKVPLTEIQNGADFSKKMN